MKRTLIAAVIALTCVLLVIPGATATPREKVGLAYSELGLGDFSFNDLVRQGALDAQDQYPIKIKERSLASPSGKFGEPSDVLTKLARGNTDLVIGNFVFEQDVASVADAHPDTDFVIIGTAPAPASANVKRVQFALNEGGFLAGVAAALNTETGHVGFIGGGDFNIPTLDALAGFEAAVEQFASGTQVSVEFVGSFRDPDRAYEIATGMYADGADVIYSVAGLSDLGVPEAARDSAGSAPSQLWAMGTDGDLYWLMPEDARPFVLTSIISGIDVATADAIAARVTGTFVGGNDRYDLRRDGIDYSTTGGFVNDIVPILEQVKQDIIDGTIVVPTS